MITRCDVDKLIDSCENNTELLVVLSFAGLGLAALEICSLSLFSIRGEWLVVRDIRNNQEKGLLLPRSIEKLLLPLPRIPEDPREIRNIVLRAAERAGIDVTPTDLRRFSGIQWL